MTNTNPEGLNRPHLFTLDGNFDKSPSEIRGDPDRVHFEGANLKSLMRRFRSGSNSRERDRLENAHSIVETLKNQIPDASPSQIDTIAAVRAQTMTSPERILALCNAVEYLTRQAIEGDFVECGVWKGGSMAAAARTLVAMKSETPEVLSRTIWMYDTFNGMSEPTEQDVDFTGETARSLLETQDRFDATSVWCRSPLEQVKETMAQTGFPVDEIRFVKGKVEETLPAQVPDKIALLRLDTDWYESTRCELEYLFPKLVPGGVLIVDDYGHWEGCRRAVDEYFDQNQVSMLLNRIDYTGRIGVFCPVNRNES